MREIKFRAWDVKNKFMYYAGSLSGVGDLFLSEYTKSETIIKTIEYEALYNTFSTVNYIWQQYTGLKDVNGKEIFENDKVRVIGREDEYQIVFDTGCFKLSNMNHPNQYLHLLEDVYPWVEVIGNIYDNPELAT